MFLTSKVSSKAVECVVDHKPVPSQLEFLKLTSADDSFCLGLTSIAPTIILSMLNKTVRKND